MKTLKINKKEIEISSELEIKYNINKFGTTVSIECPKNIFDMENLYTEILKGNEITYLVNDENIFSLQYSEDDLVNYTIIDKNGSLIELIDIFISK